MVRKSEASPFTTQMARWEFLAGTAYYLMLQYITVARRDSMFSPVMDTIDPRMLRGIARLPFGFHWSEKAFGGNRPHHDVPCLESAYLKRNSHHYANVGASND
jgi:hypothetical protein